MRALGGLTLFIMALVSSFVILAPFIIKVTIFIKNNHNNKDNDI